MAGTRIEELKFINEETFRRGWAGATGVRGGGMDPNFQLLEVGARPVVLCVRRPRSVCAGGFLHL